MLRRILSSEKIVKGEGRIKYRNLFQIFFIPRRILSYVKIVKGEGERQTRKVVFQLYRSFLLDPASQRGVTRGHTAPRCGIQEKIRQECPPNTFLLRPTLDPASQRGVTRCHTAPRCGIQVMLGRESPQNTFPFTPLSGPCVAARGDVQSYRTPMRYPEKARAGEPAEYIPFYVPLWTPRRSAG